MAYTIVRVETFRQALDLRKLRNECRRFMTRDQKKIGWVQQWKYWRDWPEAREAFIVYRDNVPVAFGVVNGNEISGGVAEAWRGEGLGRMVFTRLTEIVPKPALLEVFTDNIPAQRLYESLGWEYDDKIGNVLVMVKR